MYDLRKMGEWEDAPTEVSVKGVEEGVEETTESEAGKGIRTTRKFDFEISEFAVDPGLDLLVLVEVK